MEKPSIRINSLYKLFLNVLNVLIPFIVSPYIIHKLSRNSYDSYTNANAWMQLFLILGSFGISIYGIREMNKIKEEKEKVKSIYTSLFVLNAFSNFIFMVMYVLFFLFYKEAKVDHSLYMILGIQLIGNFFNVEWINEAFENYKFITIKTAIFRLLYCLLVFLFIKRSDDMMLYAFLISVTYALNNLISFIYIKIKLRFGRINFKEHIKGVLFVFLVVNLSLLYSQTGKIMLSLFTNRTEVTRYNLSNYIVMSLYNILIGFITVAIPRLTTYLSEKKIKEYEDLFQKLVHHFFILMIPFTIGMIVLTKEIVLFYGSEKYNDCIIPLKLFAITSFINAFYYLQGEATIYISGKEKKLIQFQLLGGVCHFIINIVLFFLNSFSATTAILSLTVSYLMVIIIQRNYIKTKLKYQQSFINRNTITLFLFSLSIFPIYRVVTIITTNSLFILFLTAGIFGIAYLFFLILKKEKEVVRLLKKSLKWIQKNFQ